MADDDITAILAGALDWTDTDNYDIRQTPAQERAVATAIVNDTK